MALLFVDNFESWSSTSNTEPGPWLRTNGANFGTTGASNNVNYSLAGKLQTASTGASGWLQKGFANSSTLIVNMRVAFASTSSSSAAQILSFLDNATVQCSLQYKTNGKLGFYRGTTTELAESVNDFSLDGTVYLDLELKVTIHNTTGQVELRVNGGVEFATAANLNTRSSANNFINALSVGCMPISGFALVAPIVDHVILMDTTGSVNNDFIGPVDVSTLRPSADGNYTDWTANTGTRWEAVNQAESDGDTTYLTSETVGDKVSFVMTDLPAGVTNVYGVYPFNKIRREQGTTRAIEFFFRSSGTDENGTDKYVGPNYAFRNDVFSQSPFTSVAWTPAEVNGLELGMEITV